MDKERLTTRFVQGFIAVVIAAAASVVYTFQAIWCSALLLNHWYPHDGQNGLAVWMIGLITLPLSFGASFWAAMVLQINWEKRRQQNESRLGAKPGFTITGRPIE
jgi:hypothetical protein